MIVHVRTDIGLGNAAVYARLRNATGQFYNFVTPGWGTLVANAKTFLTEVADSDLATSLYVSTVTVPTGGPWIVEVVRDSTGAVYGYDTTRDDHLESILTDVTTLLTRASEARLAELDAANIPTDVANVMKTTTTIADGDTLGANTALLWLRRLKWVLTGKLSVTDATGAFTLTKDDGTTAAGTGTISDDSTTTIRTVITWA